MGRAQGFNEELIITIEKHQGNRQFGNLGADGRILKLNFENWDVLV
jgi:hypothetical protein